MAKKGSNAALLRMRDRPGSGLYGHVVEQLGQDIVSGVLPAGTIVYADDLCDRLGISRSIVREALRTLSALGLVHSRPQVGTRVLAESDWDLLSPQVVRWRAQSPEYIDQMEQLLELRLGVEHAAAKLAAERLSDEAAQQILALAEEMHAAYERDDARSFFQADADFHRLILEGTGNPVIAQLARTIGPTLNSRGHDLRPGMRDLVPASVASHLGFARALVARDADGAQAIALELVGGTLEQVRARRAGVSRTPSPT